jgi:WD40 repeat protein
MKKGLLLLFLFLRITQCTVIGSDSAVSRQTKAFFKKVDSLNNLMKGFSVFNEGIVLEDAETSASFDAFFPVSGDIVLNGGTLELLSDLEFRNPFRIGPGTIKGNGFALEFPRNRSYLDFPSYYYLKLIVKLLDALDVENEVYSLDWNYNDTYLAVVLKGSNGHAELKVASFDEGNLSIVSTQDFGKTTINCVRWHPSTNYLATAAESGTELKTWFFNENDQTLTEIDSANVGNTTAVQWNPDGSYLAVGRKKEQNLLIYPVSNGVLGSVKTASFGSNTAVQFNAISWHSSGNYLAVGADELFIFSFDGNTVAKRNETDIGKVVSALSWIPETNYLTIGMQTNSESLRMYQFNESSNALSEVVSARVGLARDILGLQWSYDGKYLAVSKEYSYQDFEMEIYYYDFNDHTLHLVSGFSSDSHCRDVRWSHNNLFVALGDDNDDLFIFDFEGVPFIFDNLKLFLRSELRAHASIEITGDCVINGDGNILDLNSTASIIIKPYATLTLEDVVIKGINDNIFCQDDTAVLILRDAVLALESNTTFTQGSLRIINDVELKGDGIFLYSSALTSTINAKSQLSLEAGITFSYDPVLYHESCLVPIDKSSILQLNGATVAAGKDGLRFLNGTLRVLRDSIIQCDPSVTIDIGNENPLDDCYVDVLSGARLRLSRGVLHYKNSKESSWNSENFSFLYIDKNTQLYLHTLLNLGNGMFYFDEGAHIHRMLGGNLQGQIHAAGEFNFEYES